ncbi:MAG: FMN-binding negative transcriptional regulator [Solirubrobacteraceae bacterium]
MFVPEHYRQRDAEALFAAMRSHAFATIIGAGDDGAPLASWIPFVIEGSAQAPVIFGHLARANGQWRSWTAATPLLALFQGPHHYISPSWYEAGPNVPTWNYVAVQVRGRPRLLEDPLELEAMLDRLVAQLESARETPWRLADQAAGYRAAQAAGIVGFELIVEQITGAWKLSQRASTGDREGAIAGLRAAGGDDAQAIATLMAG